MLILTLRGLSKLTSNIQFFLKYAIMLLSALYRARLRFHFPYLWSVGKFLLFRYTDRLVTSRHQSFYNKRVKKIKTYIKQIIKQTTEMCIFLFQPYFALQKVILEHNLLAVIKLRFLKGSYSFNLSFKPAVITCDFTRKSLNTKMKFTVTTINPYRENKQQQQQRLYILMILWKRAND